MSAETLIAYVMTAGIVGGVALAWVAYTTGLAKIVLVTAACVWGALFSLALLPITIPAAAYVWHVFYRKPPAPRRRTRHVRMVTA
jgi:hypothetical protein